MRSFGCEKCADLCERVAIDLPGDLARLIARAHDRITAGTIVELKSESPLWRPFAGVPAEGPWEDIVSHTFRCKTCGQKFDLSADTFHGSGGQWCRMGA